MQIETHPARWLFLVPISLCGLFLGMSATAQDRRASPAQSEVLEEIVVTAQKRQQNLQEVPISIVAVNERELERRGLNSFEQTITQIPNVAFEGQNVGASIPAIRGISGNRTGGLSVVTVYMDETPITAVNEAFGTATPLLFDMERVEVLRGPQGTLYGASSLGGTIRLITNKPDTDAFAAKARIDFGRTDGGGNNVGLDGMINMPLVEGRFAVRAVAFGRENDGFVDRPSGLTPFDSSVIADPFAGLPKDQTENVDREHVRGARLSAKWNLTESLSITPTVFYQRYVQDNIHQVADGRPKLTNLPGIDEPRTDEFRYYNLLAEAKLPFANLTASLTRFNRESFRGTDLGDFFDAIFGYTASRPLFSFNITSEDESAEVRLFSDPVTDRGLEWTTGFFYFNTELHNRGTLIAPGFRDATGLPFPDNDAFFLKDDVRERKDLGIFGDLTWHFSPQLYVSAGARWAKDEQDQLGRNDGFFNGGPRTTVTPSDDRDVSGRLLVGFRSSDTNLIYASATQGFRPGSGQVAPPSICDAELASLGIGAAPTQSESDDLISYELGLKSEWLERRLLLNAAVFFMDWNDIQVPLNLQCGFGITANAGQATSKGAELEAVIRATRGLTLSFSAGYTDATLDSAIPALNADKGDRLLNVPKWTAASTAEYRFGAGGRVQPFARADFSYTGDMFTDFRARSPQDLRPSYSITNARFGIEADNWEASIYCDNVFNRFGTFAIDTFDSPGVLQRAINRPRTIGVTLLSRF